MKLAGQKPAFVMFCLFLCIVSHVQWYVNSWLWRKMIIFVDFIVKNRHFRVRNIKNISTLS